MQLLSPIDIYCERLDASFWSEPINAITNLAFIIAGWLLCQLAINYMKPALPWMPSGMYVGAWSALLLYAVLTQNSNPIAARYLWFAVLVFPFSLLSRQLDMPLCESGFSTHWLWHVLNGVTLYLTSYGLCQRTDQTRN
ncbi:MAG: hypothetical protein EBW16_06880 [Burkholderiaceae bacterium]|nr:hypothetical protein [Burkholderiaceae bacterium]